MLRRLSGMGKAGYFVLAGLVVGGWAGFFFLDVWLLGTFAAWIQAAIVGAKSVRKGDCGGAKKNKNNLRSSALFLENFFQSGTWKA